MHVAHALRYRLALSFVQQDCRHARNLWPVVILREEIPFDLRRASIDPRRRLTTIPPRCRMRPACRPPVEASKPSAQGQAKSTSVHRRRQPQGGMLRGLQGCPKLHSLHARIALRQVRGQAHRMRQARSKPVVRTRRRSCQPCAQRIGHPQPLERLACVAEHPCNRRRAALSTLRWRDDYLNLPEANKASDQTIDHCGGQGRKRTCSGNSEQTGRSRRGVIRLRETRHELAPVGEIDVVRARETGGSGHAVSLALKRAGAVDDEFRAQSRQVVREIRRRQIEPRLANARIIDHVSRTAIRISARRRHIERWICRKRPADTCAEVTQATGDDCMQYDLESN